MLIYEKIYTANEHALWEKLYTKQLKNLQNKAYQPFLDNIKKFGLPSSQIPKLQEVSQTLYDFSGWRIVPVNGLIDFESYFTLLSQKKFPTAIFIRAESEEDLSKDPDIFHEIFGHCTMLLSIDYAYFMHEYAKFALTIKVEDRPLFARLIWFTTETGLFKSQAGMKIFGSSILSSFLESIYCLHSDECIRKPFDVIEIFREPYRADLLQKVYYVLEDSNQLFNLLDNTSRLNKIMNEARKMGENQALFPVEHNQYTNIGYCTSSRRNNGD